MSNVINFQKPDNENKKNNIFFIKTIAVTILLLVLMKVFGISEGKPYLYQKHDVSIFRNPIEISKDYVVYGMDGESRNLSEMLDGKITILAFWATWCGYCSKELPSVGDLAPKFAERGINIIPIAVGDDTPQKILKFFERGHIKNLEPVIASSHSLYKEIGVNGYPTFIVVDENGMAFAKMRPQWEESDLSELFDKFQARGKTVETKSIN